MTDLVRKSFEPYLRIFADKPQFDRGLPPWLLIPVLAVLAVTGVLGRLLDLLTPTRSGVPDGHVPVVTEWIHGTTHDSVSKALALSGTRRLCFKPAPYREDATRVSNLRLTALLLAHGWDGVAAVLGVRGEERLWRNNVRILKLVAFRRFAQAELERCRVMVHYNDHSPYNVCARLLAERLGVRTVYVQHAPVSHRFPPLGHTLSVLFSDDSVRKYMDISARDGVPPGRYTVACDLRLPPTAELPERNASHILICYNLLDDLAEVVKCAEAILALGNDVVLRPHPDDVRRLPASISERVVVSRGRTVWDDLALAEAVVLNETAVTLEALHYGVPVLKLCSFSPSIDNYGFVETGLIRTEFEDVDGVLDVLRAGTCANACDPSKLEYFIGLPDRREEYARLIRDAVSELGRVQDGREVDFGV